MQLGVLGLGRMGANIARRLLRAGHTCVVYDLNRQAVDDLAGEGATGSLSLDDFVAQLTPPRAIVLMLPAAFVDPTIDALRLLVERDDILIQVQRHHPRGSHQFEAAQAAARAKGTYLSAQYHRLAARRGKKKAAIAVGHTILVLAYHLLSRDRPYEDLGARYFDERDRHALVRRLVRRLQHLGY